MARCASGKSSTQGQQNTGGRGNPPTEEPQDVPGCVDVTVTSLPATAVWAVVSTASAVEHDMDLVPHNHPGPVITDLDRVGDHVGQPALATRACHRGLLFRHVHQRRTRSDPVFDLLDGAARSPRYWAPKPSRPVSESDNRRDARWGDHIADGFDCLVPPDVPQEAHVAVPFRCTVAQERTQHLEVPFDVPRHAANGGVALAGQRFDQMRCLLVPATRPTV